MMMTDDELKKLGHELFLKEWLHFFMVRMGLTEELDEQQWDAFLKTCRQNSKGKHKFPELP